MKKIGIALAILVLVASGLFVVFWVIPGYELRNLNKQYNKLIEKGQYEQAIAIAKKASEFTERKFGAKGELFANSLIRLAQAYVDSGRYTEAEPLYNQALAIYENRLEPDHPDMATLLNELANLYQHQGRYSEAEPLYKRALEIREKKLGLHHPEVANSLNNLAYLYKAQNRYSEAEPLYKRALEIIEKNLGPDHPYVAYILDNLANLYKAQGRYSKAEPLYKRDLKIKEKKFGPDHPDVAISMSNLAVLYGDQGRYTEAEPLYKRSLEIKESKLGRNHPEVAASLDAIATLYQDQGRYSEAEPLYKRALEIRENKLGSDHPDVADSLRKLAVIYIIQGRYSEVEPLLKRSLKINEKKLGPDHRSVATSLNDIASLYQDQGRYSEAEPLFKRALDIREKKLGPDHPSVAVSLNNLGLFYQDQGRYSEAEPLYERALEINKKKLGPNHPNVAKSLFYIARLYQAQGRYSDAELLIKRSLNILENRVGSDHPYVAILLNSLANLYQVQGRYSDADPLHKRALEIREKKLGPNHPEVSTSLWSIASSYKAQGRYSEAETLYKRALEIRNKKFGPDHFSVANIMNSLALLYLEQDSTTAAKHLIQKLESMKTRRSSMGYWYLLTSQPNNALDYYRGLLKHAEKSGDASSLFIAYTGLGKAYEAQEEYKTAEEYYSKGVKLVEDMRSALQPSQRKNFLGVRIGGFYRSEPAKGLTRVRMKLNQAAGSIESSEMTRARAFADKIAETSELGHADVPKDVLERERRLTERVSALKRARDEQGKDKNPERYRNLTNEIEKIDQEYKAFIDMLWKKHKAYASVKYPRPVKLQDSATRPDEYFVVFDVVGEGVGVKLIRGKEIVETFYKRCDVKELEAQVKKCREPFETFQLKSFDPELGKKLYKKLLQRVLLDLPKGTPLVIIPDGILATLPFESLVVEGTAAWKTGEYGPYPTGITYLGDVHPISYYQSITALTLTRILGKQLKEKDNLLVVADPVFSINDARGKNLGTKHTSSAPVETNMYKTLMKAVEDGKTGMVKLERLPLTGKLADRMKDLYGRQSTTLIGADASKATFLKKIVPKLSQYSDIIFATHGYYGTDLPGIQQPVLFLSQVPPGVDGCLRMNEVMGFNLNADMVALTACQSGIGKHVSGEGVMGMGRAFQAAGAKSVLMSLWSVAEDSSVTMVERFFSHKKQGKTKLESLQLARKEIRDAGYEHPFFWAPFILVGETGGTSGKAGALEKKKVASVDPTPKSAVSDNQSVDR